MQPRQLCFLVGENEWLQAQLSPLFSYLECFETQSAVLFFDENSSALFAIEKIKLIPFSKAKNQLGREHSLIIYDARQSLNLDTLAIAAGTLQAGGRLYILCHHWQHLASQIDLDSQRWSGVPQGIPTPNFVQFMQQKVREYGFPVYQQHNNALFLPEPYKPVSEVLEPVYSATQDQQHILQRLLDQPKEINVITAKRGRGKSALAGLFATHLDKVILTAPNKSAVQILQDFAQKDLPFIAPDDLAQQVQQNPDKFTQYWLIIDEAAMIPLPLLMQLASHFHAILCTTTIQSYEGTGRGFLLKFMQKNHRTLQHFELNTPLRWREDDLIEPFIADLLLLEAENNLVQPNFQPNSALQFYWHHSSSLFQQTQYQALYGLLTLAHYKTSPTDLRRLLDGKDQQFLLAKAKDDLLGAVWLLQEGGIQDRAVLEGIMQGVRRPKGNLVAQILCQASLNEAACKLTSTRISRIAVQPKWQHQGIGTRLIAQVIAHSESDFLSVSFGYSAELAYFWQKCGFELVYLGEHKEASSGCYTAIALKGKSVAGKQFCNELVLAFQRNIGLSFHPLAAQFISVEQDKKLTEADKKALYYFAYYQRNLASTVPAIQCLLAQVSPQNMPLLAHYCEMKMLPLTGKKQWLQGCREEIKRLLQKQKILL
ncbi:GNAT family N-acetyltransferase [Avibacterium sp. 20-126]|uniref:GNAT family N-acetyltransferase n=1 Tax=Avibacterium sp. 20-126 TaxID=2911524 RepID=UPI002185A3F2|nr:GNAT family N-acetyltransferase [Avibacterium sp. 20-126]